MGLKETALTVIGLPTGIKRAYEVVKPYSIEPTDKALLTAAITPIAFAFPELVNTYTSLRDGKIMTGLSYIAAAGTNIAMEIMNGIRGAEFAAAHLAHLLNVDPSAAGIIGFAVASLATRVGTNVMQNVMHEFSEASGSELIESGYLSTKSSFDFVAKIAPAVAQAIL